MSNISEENREIDILTEKLDVLNQQVKNIQEMIRTVSSYIPQITERIGITSQNVRRVEEKLYRMEEALLHFISSQAGNDILKSERNQSEKRLLKFGYKVFSQNDEDGIINEIFKRIGTTNKRFIEFGVGNGLENNSLFLLHNNWSGLWLEYDENSYNEIIHNVDHFIARTGQLQVKKARVTAENINELILSAGLEGEIDFFHIDIDGNDLHVFRAIDCINPRLLMVEYNAHFPADFSWVMQYDPEYRWQHTTYYGASLSAWNDLLEKNYSLVGCNLTGNNAFFVRNDLVGDSFEAPFSPENHYEPLRYWLHLGMQPYLNFQPKVGPSKQ